MVDCTVNIINNEKKEKETVKKTTKPIKSKEKQFTGTICKKQVIHIKK